MKNDYLEQAKSWSQNNFYSENSRKEIQNLIDDNNLDEIEDRFYKDLEFGTGGMRSVLGQGRNRINEYTIRKASYALVLAVKSSFPDVNKNGQLKIAISYDSRHMSLEFAKVSATVFSANGIKALIYNRLNPVALVSFATRFHNCQAGIMVTASHNPPEYNGYKVFWNDGKQVTPPYDKLVIDNFNSINDISKIPYTDFDQEMKNNMIEWLDINTEDEYYSRIHESFINKEMCYEHGKELKVVYTAIHGSGSHPCNRALKELGFSTLFEVEEQKEPNGDFPTVKSPNPENPDALKLAVDLLNKENADLALGTDPDTDRVGIALKDADNQIVYLNGNQIGTLMLHYILQEMKRHNSTPQNAYFVKTIVTTPIQETIAKHFNIDCENTLTGFKWICQRVNEIEKESPERNFIFGTEESFGYLSHDHVRDKDGVSSIALICEIALFYKLKNKTLLDALDDIYEQFGFSNESLLCIDYFGKEGADKISRIMSKFRNEFNENFFQNKVSIKEDYNISKSICFPSGDITKMNFPKSNVLGYHLEDGSRIFLRPSGTEPKIKFYVMLQETEGDLRTKKESAYNKNEKILDEIKSFVKEV